MTSPAFQRLPVYSLRGRIAETVREAILNGTLEEGQRIVERTLAAQLGASLTAVREALIELEMDGFITKRRNAATYVTRLTLEESDKIFAVRTVLEAYAVKLAAQAITPEQIERLESLYVQMLDAARANDRKVFMQRDYAWHEFVWRVTGNEYLQAALKRIVVPLFAFTAMRILNRSAFNLVHDAESHVPLLEALKAHDPERARTSLLEGLRQWNSLTRTFVFGQQAQPGGDPAAVTTPQARPHLAPSRTAPNK